MLAISLSLCYIFAMKLYPISFLLRMTVGQEVALIKMARKNNISEAQVLRNFLEEIK